MKILFICHRFPYPPKRGGKIRPFNVIRHLSERGHEVTVASLNRSPQERLEGAGLAAHCRKIIAEDIGPNAARWRMIANVFRRAPSSMGYFFSPELRRRIEAELRDNSYDMAFVHCSSVAPYVADADVPLKILDFGDMDSQKWLTYARVRSFPVSAGYWLEGHKLRREEERLARAFHICTCTTRAERETLEGYGTGVPTAWFPNGVDLDHFAPSDAAYDPDQIAFLGRMDYFPNIECMTVFCRETLPLLRRIRPGIRLLIVGANPVAAIRRLAESEGIVVTGSVKDVRPHVHGSALTVAPLNIARGTQNKILESLAMGVPCISSDLAAQGVDCTPGEHLLTASRPEDYVRQVLRLLESPEERRRFALAGRRRVETNHSWAGSMRMLDTIIEDGARRLEARGRHGRP